MEASYQAEKKKLRVSKLLKERDISVAYVALTRTSSEQTFSCFLKQEHEEKMKKLTEENSKQMERIYELKMELAEVKTSSFWSDEQLSELKSPCKSPISDKLGLGQTMECGLTKRDVSVLFLISVEEEVVGSAAGARERGVGPRCHAQGAAEVTR